MNITQDLPLPSEINECGITVRKLWDEKIHDGFRAIIKANYEKELQNNSEVAVRCKKYLQKYAMYDKKYLVYRFREACEGGDIEVVKCLIRIYELEKYDILQRDKETFHIICSCENLEVIKWVVENFKITCDDVKELNIHVLKRIGHTLSFLKKKVLMENIIWLMGTFDVPVGDIIKYILKNICVHGNIEAGKLLIKEFKITPEEIQDSFIDPWYKAEILKWI